MKLSSTVEQACCIIAILASREKQRLSMTNDKLSEMMAVSPTYLKKITRKLVVKDIITSTQGVGGGLELARSLDKLTLKQIVEAVEGDNSFFQSQGIIERVFSRQSRRAAVGMNIIEQRFNQAQQKWNEVLEQTTLADISKEITKNE